jgi:hypothetical protein
LLSLATGCVQGPGQIELSATEHDFGTIPNTKPVIEVFEVRNIGRGKLEIARVSTSCGCTTEELDRCQPAPGEMTELVVTYDRQAHGGVTGQFRRVMYVRTDDPDLPEATLTIRVTVTES